MAEASPPEREAGGRPAGSLDALLTRYLPDLQAYVRLRAGPKVRALESCSDLVQSVCREVLSEEAGFDYQGEAAFRQWMFKAAERKIIDRLRYHGSQKRDVDRRAATGATTALAQTYARIHTPSRDADIREQIERLESAMDELPPDYRQAIVLFHVVGLSHAEIAQELGRSVGATRNLLYRAVTRVARIVARRAAG